VRYGEIVVVGGGCYGTFYAGQLAQAKARGKTDYDRVVVVDRDPQCRMVRELGEDHGRSLKVADWDVFFDDFLGARAAEPSPRTARGRLSRRVTEPSRSPDAIVPSPLMPHLMYDWLLRRARARWPDRTVETAPFSAGPGTPYDRAAPDGTRYVSFADWLCPTHCIEPAICPVTRAPRTWEMSDTLHDFTRRLGAAGPVLFRCEHQVFGVGMFLVDEVLAGDARVRDAGRANGPVDLLVGTISGCHGALNLLRVGPA
jgi:hypothetical protein